MPKIIPSASAVAFMALFTSAALGANTTWIFKFGASAATLGNASPSGIIGGLAIDPPGPSRATYKSPSGGQGFVAADSGSGIEEGFTNVAQFEAIDGNPATPWSLAQGNSHYTFVPDFSGVNPASVPLITINGPIDASTTSNPPTLRWSMTGTAPITIIQINNASFSVDEQFVLPGTFTSLTLPQPLPAGTYNFFIDASSAAVTIPVSTTLVSGPDLKILPEGSFQFTTEAISTFVVNPALAGDANADGRVDLNDLNIVLNNLGTTTPNWSQGNFDGAATIDLNDLNQVLNNLGTGSSAAAAVAGAAPEPGSLGFLCAGLTLALRRKR